MKPRFPPNQVFKNDQEVIHVPDDDLVNVVEILPRVESGPLNARIWLDASGQLNILPEGGGWLGIPDEVLHTLVEANAAWDPD